MPGIRLVIAGEVVDLPDAVQKNFPPLWAATVDTGDKPCPVIVDTWCNKVFFGPGLVVLNKGPKGGHKVAREVCIARFESWEEVA